MEYARVTNEELANFGEALSEEIVAAHLDDKEDLDGPAFLKVCTSAVVKTLAAEHKRLRTVVEDWKCHADTFQWPFDEKRGHHHMRYHMRTHDWSVVPRAVWCEAFAAVCSSN